MGVTVTCRECGKTSEQTSGDLQRLAAEKLCFTCNFWLEYVAHRDEPIMARINGRHYVIGPADSPFPGFGGREHTIRFADGRTVTTRNLWHQGEIPPHFRERLPDNAEFTAADKAA